jgi:hypothetical protein
MKLSPHYETSAAMALVVFYQHEFPSIAARGQRAFFDRPFRTFGGYQAASVCSTAFLL